MYNHKTECLKLKLNAQSLKVNVIILRILYSIHWLNFLIVRLKIKISFKFISCWKKIININVKLILKRVFKYDAVNEVYYKKT